MSKAEERALEKYPTHSVLIVPARRGGYYADSHLREGFIEGYHQAQKDLELTWEDVHAIAIIEDKLIHELCLDDQTLPQTQEFYTEVLKRFKLRKGK